MTITDPEHDDSTTDGGDLVGEAAAANAEVQAVADQATADGYVGVVPDATPNSAYSLQSGPDSPPLAPDDRTRFPQPSAAPMKETPNA